MKNEEDMEILRFRFFTFLFEKLLPFFFLNLKMKYGSKNLFGTNLVLLRPITKYTQAPSTVTDHWTSTKENKVTVSVNRPKLFLLL